MDDDMDAIFVDIDGVLNSPATWGNRPLAEAIDPDKLVRLSALAHALDAQIVISSSIRYQLKGDVNSFRTLFVSRGFDQPERITSCTERCAVGETERFRGVEIRAWLDANPSVSCFVILDDLGLKSFEGLGRHLIQTNGSVGLTDTDCLQAIQSMEWQKSRGK
jgi:hypothetical protein